MGGGVRNSNLLWCYIWLQSMTLKTHQWLLTLPQSRKLLDDGAYARCIYRLYEMMAVPDANWSN